MAEKIQIRSSFPEVPYLKSEIINKFGNIIVKTADRLEFKINSLILVSVSQLFKNFLKNIYDDAQEHGTPVNYPQLMLCFSSLAAES